MSLGWHLLVFQKLSLARHRYVTQIKWQLFNGSLKSIIFLFIWIISFICKLCTCLTSECSPSISDIIVCRFVAVFVLAIATGSLTLSRYWSLIVLTSVWFEVHAMFSELLFLDFSVPSLLVYAQFWCKIYGLLTVVCNK